MMMIFLVSTLLLFAVPSWAQQPALRLVAGRDSLGVGDTLEVWVEVDAQGRMLTSASAIVALAGGIFVPLSETPFAGGDFLPGQVYDNAAAQNGEELQLSYVAVSGTGEEGERLAATGQGVLARFWVRAIAPSAGTYIRLEGTGAHRSIYTAPGQPGVEQRFALPELPLQVRVGGQAEVVQPAEEVLPTQPEPVLPEPPAQVSAPVNTPPLIAALAPLAVAVGGESFGPLLASFLSDAQDAVEELQVEVEGDGQVAARLEGGRLVVRGLRAGLGQVKILAFDTQGAQAGGLVQVEVRVAGQGPRFRTLPRVGLAVGGEKALDLAAYVFDPDTPLASLSWTLVPEGGVEAILIGTQLQLRGTAAGPARISLQAADPEGNVAAAALAVQVEEPTSPAAPADTAAVPAAPVPDSAPETVPPDAEPPQESTPLDSALTVQTDTSAQSGNAATAPQEENQVQPNADTEEPAALAGEEENQVQPSADTEELAALAGEGETSGADTVQTSQNEGSVPAVVVSPEPGVVDTARADSVRVLPETDTGPSPTAETPPVISPFAPIVEAPAPSAPQEEAVPASAPQQGESTVSLLEIEEAVEYQVVAGRIDSGLVVDRWVKRGEPGQVQWSLRGGKRLLARLEAGTRRLYLDARSALPGREVLFAEAVLGEERRQATLGVDVRAPRLLLLPFPALELEADQQFALDLDSYVEGDFTPSELSWAVEAPQGAGVELDVGPRVLRLSASGTFSVLLRVSSPWGNKAEVLLQVRGITQPTPALADTAAPPATVSALPEPIAEEPVDSGPQPVPPVPPPLSEPPPADVRPPLLRLEEVALGAEVELWVRADEELRAPPVVRVNGQVLEVEGAGSEYRVRYAPQDSALRVQVEGEDLAGNAGQALAALMAHRVQPGSARLRSPDGRWQAHFPQVRREAWVLFRQEEETQCLDFDADRTGPVELVAAYSGNWPPAILRAQGEGWEELPTYSLSGGRGVFARSEWAGAFKLGGQAAGVLPAQPLVYPNPFNARAAIRYQVAGRGAVRVRVRDGQGRVVRLLVDQVQEPGVWTAAWDGRDGAGQGAASGVYFFEVEAAGKHWTGKLLLLR